MATDFAAVVMAAGLGTRMKSATPKHLHPLLGRRLVDWVVAAVRPLGPDPLVVVLSPEAAGALEGVEVAVQERPLGTGDSLRSARESVGDARTLLVVSGDHPRISPGLLQQFVEEHRSAGAPASVLSFEPPDPRAYGRVIRDAGGHLQSIVEDADADDEQRAIREVNSSIYVFETAKLWPVLERIEPAKAPDADEVEGVNTRAELADAASFLRARVNKDHMLAGVTIVDPQTTWIDPEVELAADST